MLNVERIRFAENSNMQAIISEYCSGDVVDEYYTYMLNNLKLQDGNKENHADKVANYIYETRCKIAHFKYGQEKIRDRRTLSKSNIILSRMVKNIYQKLDEKLVDINKKIGVWKSI